MKRQSPLSSSLCLLCLLTGTLQAATIDIVNPSAEINSGVDGTAVSDASVLGWDGSSAQVLNGNTDFGNLGWRFSYEDSGDLFQMTGHTIETGASYSLRFDAALFSNNSTGFAEDLLLIGPGPTNGDFEADTSSINERSFEETPGWSNLVGAQTEAATRNAPADLVLDNRNAVVSAALTGKVFGADTTHTLTTGEVFQASFSWIDAYAWDDASDRISVTLFTTADDMLTGAQTVLQTLQAPASTQNEAYENAALIFDPIPASANGKKLFLSFRAVDGNADNSGFARVDNFRLARGMEFGSLPRLITTDFYVDDGGSPLVIASRDFTFKSGTGIWDHYHMAVTASTLDAHAGKTLGVRFRSNNGGIDNYQSIDNVRLDYWPSGSPNGAFSDNWNSTPNQTWAGPNYWANRLQDWRVNNSRAECTQGGRDRMTLHRPGTSIRGNGENFSFSVRTGLNGGSHTSSSRTGFLIGAGPNLDWRGALLVSDGLGRDFGLFLGLRGDGSVTIDDYSTGSVTSIAASAVPAAGFVEGSRLDLSATYNTTPGTYTLTIEAYDLSNSLLASATIDVPSDRVIGALGLLSHRGGSSARYWFDDYSGSGNALHPETERHLAVIGAMHTLSEGTLKLTAQLSPYNVATANPVALDIWNGAIWQQIATTLVDNTDNFSSHTATFKVENWDDTVDTDYRVRVTIDGNDYLWNGTIRKDPVNKEELVIAMTTCQRISNSSISGDGIDWTPVFIWQPHPQTYTHVGKHQPDVILAHGDQIYEDQPTKKANNSRLDYLYKWNLWVLQIRELSRDIPVVAIPDDHDVYQGNLWGEGGVATNDENNGGYTQSANWVRMVERTQTSNLPDPDPYNPTQPAPPVLQNIGVYFTGMTYGRLGFAILEDRKWKTGRNNPPADPNDQFLLGDRQKDFLRAWNEDWAGQDLKLVVSQSPMGNIHTHGGSGYRFNLNDPDTHGWPVHRRNEAWELWRASRMFQLAGDQHLSTLVHHGVDGPRDAGFSMTAPAIANFWPRGWDPVHNSGGTTSTVSPYTGDFYFDGNGTLPDGVTPNLTANDPHHIAVLGAANPLQYYRQTGNINPSALHDRGAGYSITRVNKTTREITFESWPIHADPEFPQTGGQFSDWPQTILQTDNDGRTPTGFLPVVDTHWRNKPVIRVFDETTDELVYAMRIRGNRFRPPVYDNGTTYRVEIAYDDEAVSETLTAQTASVAGTAAINFFGAQQPSIISGNVATLQWDVSAATSLSIDQGVGDVATLSVDGIGYIEVSPANDTIYTLTLNGSIVATTTVRVFPDRIDWNNTHFTPAEQFDPLISDGGADPDGDGFTNDEEFQFQSDPRSVNSVPTLQENIVKSGGQLNINFSSPFPLDPESISLIVESSTDLSTWNELPANSYSESGRTNNPAEGTSQIMIELDEPLPPDQAKEFYRARWDLN